MGRNAQIELPPLFELHPLAFAIAVLRIEQRAQAREVGAGGHPRAGADQFAGIGLTTYEIDTKEMAKRVVHIILHKLLNARYSTGTFVIPGRFIERESVRRIGPPVPFV